MIQLTSVLWLSIFTFAVIGYLRGFDKELVSLAGIILALFTLVQFNDFFVSLSGGEGGEKTLFYIQAGIILVVTFYAYQTPPDKLAAITTRSTRDKGQTKLLGMLLGGFNGYLVFGSLWYFLNDLGYPLESITPPAAGTASAEFIDNLPLVWLLQGNLLTLFVIGLFLFILIVII